MRTPKSHSYQPTNTTTQTCPNTLPRLSYTLSAFKGDTHRGSLSVTRPATHCNHTFTLMLP